MSKFKDALVIDTNNTYFWKQKNKLVIRSIEIKMKQKMLDFHLKKSHMKAEKKHWFNGEQQRVLK